MARKVFSSNGRRNAPPGMPMVCLAPVGQERNIAADVLFGGVMRLT
ncbi:MAG: hypothetical protein QOG78_1121 [Rhodospirillaceae bacterium]|nr:hypothetical protein [Rhodospirillaceae bacterium]